MAGSESVDRLTREFAKLPGIGAKSAERLTHYILQASEQDALGLAHAIEEVKTRIRHCSSCFNLTEAEFCGICQDATRDGRSICVVEQPRDLMAIEATGAFRGRYHVLLGRIAPLEGMTPDRLTIDPLIERVRREGIEEVIMATNPTTEGDGTALHLSNLLADYSVRVTRLARGLATGSVLEFANRDMLADALDGRQRF